MRRGLGWRLSAAFAVAIIALLACAAPAFAHEARDVGAYHFLVGWGNEPAYAGQENSVQLILAYRATGKPVVNLGSTLHVTVIYGTQSLVFGLEPTFDPDTRLGTPGDYRAWLYPTAPGDYTFHFTGTIGSQAINQSFTSGPTTFATVQDPTAVEFPVQTPTMTELAQRVNVSLPRLASSSQASRAQLFGIIGMGVGALGLIVAVFALLARRSPAAVRDAYEADDRLEA
jgi:hypothetical protein